MKNQTAFRKTVETGAVWIGACPAVLLLSQSSNYHRFNIFLSNINWKRQC